MKVLHVISGIDPVSGGTATALLALAQAQQSSGLRVAVAHSFINPPDHGRSLLQQHGIELHDIGPCRGSLSRHPDMVPILSGAMAQADVVHVHAMWEEIQYQGARLARRMRKPYVMTPHGMLDPWSLSQRRLKKKLYLALRMRRNLNHASAIHFTTTTERDLVKPLGLTAPTLVEPNGVDLAEFADLPSRGTFRARHPQIGRNHIVLFLGRIHYKKGFDLLIPAFAQTKLPESMLVVAGPDHDNYRSSIERFMRDCALPADRVLFTGMLRGRQRIEAFVDADLFVLPSYQENFGIAVIEALAAGCPVIISDQVNICEEIRAAGVGAVVPTQVEPLASEIARWMGDDMLRAQASRRAIPFVSEHYDWNKIAGRWVGHYQSLKN